MGNHSHTKIVPTQLPFVLYVPLGGKHKDENVQTCDTHFMWFAVVPRPGPFECALKTQMMPIRTK